MNLKTLTSHLFIIRRIKHQCNKSVGRATHRKYSCLLTELPSHFALSTDTLRNFAINVSHNVEVAQTSLLNLHPQYLFCILKYDALNGKESSGGSDIFIVDTFST